MPHPLLIFSQSDYLIQIVDRNSHTEWHTVQVCISLASKEANWSGATLFQKSGHILVQQDHDKYEFSVNMEQPIIEPIHAWSHILFNLVDIVCCLLKTNNWTLLHLSASPLPWQPHPKILAKIKQKKHGKIGMFALTLLSKLHFFIPNMVYLWKYRLI